MQPRLTTLGYAGSSNKVRRALNNSPQETDPKKLAISITASCGIHRHRRLRKKTRLPSIRVGARLRERAKPTLNSTRARLRRPSFAVWLESAKIDVRTFGAAVFERRINLRILKVAARQAKIET